MTEIYRRIRSVRPPPDDDATMTTCPKCEGHGCDPRDPRRDCDLCQGRKSVFPYVASSWCIRNGRK